MRVFVVTPPDPVVDWEAAEDHLKLDGDEERRVYVQGLIEAATAHLDGPDGWLGRSLGRQTLEARFDTYNGGCEMRLPYRPIVSVTSLTYLDSGRNAVTIDPDAYELMGADLAAIGSPAWHGGYVGREALRVRYVAGYETLPAPIRHAILMMVADMFENPQTATILQQYEVPMSVGVKSLLQPYQVYA
jgi:uncharacterized phiE125 gp8 family phage protein